MALNNLTKVTLLATICCGACCNGLLAQTNVSIDAATRKAVGGVQTLDREQYFNYHGTLVPPSNTNLGNLRQETWSPDGLNLAPGRASTELDQFISNGLPESATKPGHVDESALRAKLQGSYRDFVVNGSRWEATRNHEDAIFVQSGRNGGFWPDYLDGGTQMPTNFEAYADFMNVYLDEVVYGNNAFMPVRQDRFYYEVMNEPQWTGASWNDVIEMHQFVTELVKEEHPQVRIGGATCCDVLSPSSPNSWEMMKQMIDDMATWQTPSGESVELDYWSIHTYERYDVAANGSYSQATFTSPGHVAGIMDLFENYGQNKLGDPKSFAVTEYGSWNRTDMADGSYGSYARDEQQWDLVRDVREQMLIFMERPDRIINATPFVSPRHWQNAVPTNPAGDNVFFEQVAGGDWVETIVGNYFRMLAPVSGEYIDISHDSTDLQSNAFRDGNTVYIMLNNLDQANQQVNLTAFAGLGDVESASWSRIYRSAGTNHYIANADITSDWQNLNLEGEAGALVTLQLSGPEIYDRAYDSKTFYGDQTEIPIVTQQLIPLSINADTEDAVAAKLRIGYGNLTSGLPLFSVRVNGNSFTITADDLARDDNDHDLITREINVPVEFLTDGANDITFFFPFSSSGTISSAVLEVTRSVGDYDASGVLGGGDIDQLYQQFGAVASGSKFDLTEDGAVDSGDVDHWLALRNTVRGDADVDGDIDSRDAVALLAHLGSSTGVRDWTRGNFNGDSDTDTLDLGTLLNAFDGAGPSTTTGPTELPGAAENPDIVYNPETGEISVSADGQTVLAFHLSTEDTFLSPADYSALDTAVGSVSPYTDNESDEVGWISGSVNFLQGLSEDATASLGLLLPSGLDAASLAAFFADASWAGVAAGGQFDLILLAEGLTGDFNEDGVVDAADYTVWRDTLGSTTDLRADANGDQVVDSADYALWRSNFGQMAGAATGSLRVPEASSCLLLLLAGGIAGVCRSSRR